MITVSRHDKKRRTVCRMRKNQGSLACPLCHLPAWHWRSKLVSLIQLIRGSGGIDHEKSRSRSGAVRRRGAYRRAWRCQCVRNPGKRRPHQWPVAARPAAISRAGLFEGSFTGHAARREIRWRRIRVELWEFDHDPWAWHRSAGACLGPLARRHQPTLTERSFPTSVSKQPATAAEPRAETLRFKLKAPAVLSSGAL